MKRPAAVFGLAFIFAISMQSLLGAKITYFHFIIPLTAFVAFFTCLFLKNWSKRKFFAVISGAALSGAAMFILFGILSYQPVLVLADSSCTVRARLCELPYINGHIYCYPLKTETLDGAPLSFNFTLKSNTFYDLEPYDILEGRMIFYHEHSDSRIADGFYLNAFSDDEIKIIKTDSKNPMAFILKIRKSLIMAADDLYTEQDASFVKALFIGDKSSLSKEITDSFRKTGLAHILVISGTHMSCLSAAVIWLMRKMFRRVRIADAMSIPPVIFFMALTGFQPSVVRSGIGVIAYLTANVVFRESDPLTSLGLAAMVICSPNPYTVFDCGVLMSFSSALAIILFSQKFFLFFRRRIPPFTRKGCAYALSSMLINVVSVSVCASAASLPFLTIKFKTVSNIIIPANLIIVPLVPVILVVSCVSLVLYYIPILRFFSRPLSFISSLLSRAVLVSVRLASKIPFSCSVITKGYIAWFVSIAIVTGLALIYFKKTRAFLPILILLLIALQMCILFD